jgi:hypothetical protein
MRKIRVRKDEDTTLELQKRVDELEARVAMLVSELQIQSEERRRLAVQLHVMQQDNKFKTVTENGNFVRFQIA